MPIVRKQGIMANSKCLNWFFGRGLSISCGLPWVVPPEWASLPRETKIDRIKATLRTEMDGPSVDTTPIRRSLYLLKRHTLPNWKHHFITTNWDYLLQREIQALNLAVLPLWLTNSHVFHLNGTVEELTDNSNRSQFLLEEDPGSQRSLTVEANVAYNHISWSQFFVVVGMSFECETDKFLLSALNRVEDDMPIGESNWIIINPDRSTLEASSGRIAAALPRASVRPVCLSIEGWLDREMPDLCEYGVLSF
jgi:hypothetical protein